MTGPALLYIMCLPRSVTSSGPEMNLMKGVVASQEAARRVRQMRGVDALMVRLTVLAYSVG